ncbi:MAG: N-acetylmuramoyl-L-alanine amidase [bacterium]
MRDATKLLILVVFLLLSLPLAAAGEEVLEVMSREVAVYSSIGSGGLDARLYRGSLVTSSEEKDGWHRVRLRNGVEGWVQGWLVRKAPSWVSLPGAFDEELKVGSENPVYGKVIVESAEIRSAPYSNLNSKRDTTRIGLVVRGTVLKVTDVIFNWMRVELSPWEWGWVYSEALEPASGEAWAPSRVLSVSYAEDGGERSIELALERPVPYSLWQTAKPGTARFALYGVDCEGLPDDFFAVEHVVPGSGLRCEAAASQVTGGIYSFNRPAGCSASMEGGKFRLSVKTGLPAVPLVVLDPGHGAPEPNPRGYREGAVSPDGKLLEKDVALDIALRLKKLLEKSGVRVEMTRAGDSVEMMDPYRRVEFADARDADIFVSIHLNGDADRTMQGAEVYWYDPLSRPLAEAVAEPLSGRTGREAGLAPFGSFAVIRTPRRPSVLVEAAYLTNPGEAGLLATEDFRQKIAEGIAEGIAGYLSR